MRATIAVLFVGAALALGACGGDDDDSEQSTAPATTTTEPTPTETTPTDTTPDEEAAEDRGSGSNREQSEDDARGEGDRRERGERDSSGDRGSGRLTGSQRDNYRFAQSFCSLNPPQFLARQYGLETSDPVRVAREYARRAYSGRYRDVAFRGCRSGFRNPQQ